MSAMTQKRLSPTQQGLGFDYEEGRTEQTITALAGIPLLVQAFRSLGLPASAKRNLSIKQRERGYDEATYVESFVILNAAGGECLDDFAHLRKDAIGELVGHELPSPEAARNFLYQFHDEENIEQARKQLAEGKSSYIVAENAALRGLGQVNTDLVQELARRGEPQKIATVDLDSTVIESWKREAQPTYQGGRGYQPMLALWAEMNLIVADEFRDGNVPAQQQPLAVTKRAFLALPSQVTEYYFRGDSACHEAELISWLRDENRAEGPKGRIGFAVSVRMFPSLKKHIQRLPNSAWKPYREDSEAEIECADVLNYWPEAGEEKEYGALRWIAIRVKKRQGELFADGSEHKYFAVMTNLWEWKAKTLLQWHREKAGTIEAIHDILKNELAAGVLPCGRFGANAAWLRMSVLTHNLMTALKRMALPEEYATARPKRLRLLIFNTAGRIIHHARQVVCRIVGTGWGSWLALMPLPAT
jgi:Transposase DDE domain group 1